MSEQRDDDVEIQNHFQELCRALNLDCETEVAAWTTFTEVSMTYSLQVYKIFIILSITNEQ